MRNLFSLEQHNSERTASHERKRATSNIFKPVMENYAYSSCMRSVDVSADVTV